jgi:hypothetical protein
VTTESDIRDLKAVIWQLSVNVEKLARAVADLAWVVGIIVPPVGGSIPAQVGGTARTVAGKTAGITKII